MSIAIVLLCAGVALGAGGYFLASPAMSTWGFAFAVAALVAWLLRNAWDQRADSNHTSGATQMDKGPGAPPGTPHEPGSDTGAGN